MIPMITDPLSGKDVDGHHESRKDPHDEVYIQSSARTTIHG